MNLFVWIGKHSSSDYCVSMAVDMGTVPPGELGWPNRDMGSRARPKGCVWRETGCPQSEKATGDAPEYWQVCPWSHPIFKVNQALLQKPPLATGYAGTNNPSMHHFHSSTKLSSTHSFIQCGIDARRRGKGRIRHLSVISRQVQAQLAV